jgi:hypothetical protein
MYSFYKYFVNQLFIDAHDGIFLWKKEGNYLFVRKEESLQQNQDQQDTGYTKQYASEP